MKQTAFDTRQRANELLQEAAAIWRQSAHSNQLEGIERDPIFSLLMTALAYQANEIDSDIERIKQDVLEEYIKLMTPYEAGRPIPATAVVEAVLRQRPNSQKTAHFIWRTRLIILCLYYVSALLTHQLRG